MCAVRADASRVYMRKCPVHCCRPALYHTLARRRTYSGDLRGGEPVLYLDGRHLRVKAYACLSTGISYPVDGNQLLLAVPGS